MILWLVISAIDALFNVIDAIMKSSKIWLYVYERKPFIKYVIVIGIFMQCSQDMPCILLIEKFTNTMPNYNRCLLQLNWIHPRSGVQQRGELLRFIVAPQTNKARSSIATAIANVEKQIHTGTRCAPTSNRFNSPQRQDISDKSTDLINIPLMNSIAFPKTKMFFSWAPNALVEN